MRMHASASLPPFDRFSRCTPKTRKKRTEDYGKPRTTNLVGLVVATCDCSTLELVEHQIFLEKYM